MTIDEAIEKYNKLANNDRTCCKEEAYQLAEWLEELKMLRELKAEHRKIGNIEGFNTGYLKRITANEIIGIEYMDDIEAHTKFSENNADIAFEIGGIKGMTKVQNTLKRRYQNEQSI